MPEKTPDDFYLAIHSESDFLQRSMSEEEANPVRQSKNVDDYTFLDSEMLWRFVTATGKILPRRITGFSAKQQRHLTRTIKQARNILLLK